MNEQERFKEILAEAASRQGAAERAAYLDGVCGADRELRARIDSLLQLQERVKDFLEKGVEITAGDLTREGAGTVIGQYKLLQELGEGAFGIVYLAEQMEPVKRKVALKIIKPGMDTREVVARFEVERQALALMDHPNIAQVFDGGVTESGRPYFVMELVEGLPVTEYCDRERLNTEQRLVLFMKICQAVQHAHQKGIIHRDLKPSNILVTVVDGQPAPKVIDFGVAKALGHRLSEKTFFTMPQQMIGTPAYMSPEQAALSGVDVDTRSDIYSLGVVLYVLLAGATPFDEGTFKKAALDEVRRIIREVEPPKPSTRLKTLGPKLTTIANCHGTDAATLPRVLDGDLDWIVMKCLEKDRQRRYETAIGLAQDLERHLSHQPVLVRPASVGYRMKKFYRRNTVLVLAGGTVAISLVAGLTSSSVLFFREKSARGRAEASERLATQRAVVEAKAKAEAEEQRSKVEKTLNRMELRQAEELFSGGDCPAALAHLARVLRRDSSNRVAAERLVCALSHRNFTLPITQPLKHGYEVALAQFSSDSRRVSTTSDGGVVRVWDAETGQALGEAHDYLSWEEGLFRLIVPIPSSYESHVDLTREGHLLMSFNVVEREKFVGDVLVGEEFVHSGIWDAHSRRQLTPSLKGAGKLSCFRFSADGERVVTGSWEGIARVWDTGSGEPLSDPVKHSAPIRSVDFSPDGKQVATASDDGSACVWDARTGKAMTQPMTHSSIVSYVRFSPEGQRLVTGSWDATARIWDAESGAPLTGPMKHSGMVLSAQFSPDGGRVVTASRD